MNQTFRRTEILIPQGVDMEKWSVVACDQFTAQPEYWAVRERECAGVPSALHLMLPEAYLAGRDPMTEAARINAEMDRYLAEGVFRALPESFVYVERTLQSGATRRGIVGALDLEDYDFSPDSASPVRATEGTVASRLPARVRVREGAALEMPHTMVFIDDEADRVLATLTAKRAALEPLYDFDLSAGGGHIRGWRVSGADADGVDAALAALAEAAAARSGEKPPVLFAMGDGNHSLATAKRCWEALKPTLSEAARETHPARFSLVELVNIHDPAVTFEPIHRVIFHTRPAEFYASISAAFSAVSRAHMNSHTLRLATPEGEWTVRVGGLTIGQVIDTAEDACRHYMDMRGGEIDYIHGDDTALEMGSRPGCAALLLPRMEKSELFPSVEQSGPFPRKSFSIGHAEDKRYYLECRRIR